MMKRFLNISILLLLTSSSVLAQKNREASPQLPDITLSEAMRQYRFADAEMLLNHQIADLRKKKLDTSGAEEQLRHVQRAKGKLHVTEKITFIDSVVVHIDDLIKYFYLSDESGRVDTYKHHFHAQDSTRSTVYLSQLGDRVYYGKASENGTQLYTSSLIGAEWTDAAALSTQGLDVEDYPEQNYPFVLSDGATLYFAAKGEESLGGYDIFMTRYDADEHCFLAPENIGMPFNSPANDYLYAVDEFHHIGWFATDRNLPADSVCIYTFIPNTSRQVYNTEQVSEDQLRSLACLNSIRDTWSDNNLVQNNIHTLNQLKQQTSTNEKGVSSRFLFVVDDARTYTSPSQFRSAEARKQSQFWLEGTKDLERQERELQKLRETYAVSDKNAQQTLVGKIRDLENKVNLLVQNLRKQEKEIRRLESM